MKKIGKRALALLVSCLLLVSMMPVVGVASESGSIIVGTEEALREEIANAPTGGTETVIALFKDIDIADSKTIEIAAGQNIVLKGDYALVKANTSTNKLIFVAKEANLVLEDVDINMNGTELNKNALAFEVTGTATLKGSAEVKDGRMAGDGSVVHLNGGSVFTMEGNSKITNWSSTNDTVSTSIIRPQLGGTFIMKDNAEISGNTVKEGVVSPTNSSFVSDRFFKVYIYGGKIVNNQVASGLAFNLSNDSGAIENEFSGSAEIEGVVGLDTSLKITSALQYPIVYQQTEGLAKDGDTDADEDGIIDYYTTVVAEGSDGYALRAEDLEKISVYNEGNDYIPCLKASDSKIYMMDADADAKDGFTAKAVTKYTVKFYDGDRTTVMKEQMVREGQNATPPQHNPTKANSAEHSYLFKDWEDYTNITADRNVYPTFEEVALGNIYTVIFVDGDGNEIDEQSVLEGQAAVEPAEAPTKTNEKNITYTFKGWDKTFDNITENTTVTALFDAYYTITFKYGLSGETSKTVVVKNGEDATAPEVPAITDWEFTGWDTDIKNVNSVFAATAQYTYTGDYTYEVTNEEELRAAIAIAYTGAENPITIKLLTDITITSTATSNGGFAFTNQYINFTGDGSYSIIKAHKGVSRISYGQLYQKAFIGVSGGQITFDGVNIDMNADDDQSNGGRTFFIKDGGKVTVKNATVKDGGFAKADSGNTDYGMVAYIDGSASTFTLGEGGKITGFASNAAKDGNLIGFAWGGTFVIDGGEISGNTVKSDALIRMDESGFGNAYGNAVTIKLLSGKIVNNTWNTDSETKYTYRGYTNNGTGDVQIGSVEIDGVIGGSSSAHVPKIVGALVGPIIVKAGGLSANQKRDDDNNTIVGCYGGDIATGKDYTITNSDLKNIYWQNNEDEGLVLYLDTKNNVVNAMDEGTTQRYPDRWITKAEADTVTYKVTFVNWDDSVIDEQIIVEGMAATAPADPTKTVEGENWKFTGWDTAFDAVNSNMTVKAEYIQIFTVKFYSAEKGTEGIEVISEQQIEAGQAAVAPDVNPEKESDGDASYDFAGWSEDFTAVNSNLDIYPTFNEVAKLPVYEVKFFDAEGVQIGETQNIEQGKAATAPETDPTKTVEGQTWRFDGWDKAFTDVQGNLDINPVFVQQFKVTFNDYDNKALKTEYVDAGKAATAPSVPDIKTYLSFDGTWEGAFDNITADTTVKANYTYIGGRTFDVGDLTTFQDVITYIPADGELVTINITNDFEAKTVFDTLTNTVLTTGKNVLINGNNHTVTKTDDNPNKDLNPGDSALAVRAWFIVDGATVEIKDWTIDVNDANVIDSFYKQPANTTAVYVNAGVLTLSGNTTLTGGLANDGKMSMAAEVENGTLIMKDNATITNFAPRTTDGTNGNSLIGVKGSGKFIMNGGSITGNTVNNLGIITWGAGNGYNNNVDSRVELNGGVIKNNTELGETAWAVHLRSNNSNYASIILGGGAEIEGLIGGASGAFAPQITGELLYPVTVSGFDLGAGHKRDDTNNPKEGCYGNAIARGLDYTLTTADLMNVYWQNETDSDLVLYLDTKDNGVYAMDQGVAQVYPDRWITKAEAEGMATIAIDDVTLADSVATVTYTLTGKVTGKPIAAIYVGGVLKAVNYSEASAELTAGTKTIEVNTALASLEGATVKVFIWNEATFAPLVDPAVR